MPRIEIQNSRKVITKPNAKLSARNRVASLADVPRDGIKLGVYGHSGTGKTRFMSTFATEGRMLHMICSSNGLGEALSIRGIKNIDVVEIKEPKDISELVQLAKDEEYVTVALDHVTSFCDLVLSRIMGIEKMPEQSSWGLATQKQYQQQGLQVRTYLRELFDLSCNVLISGQERVFKSTLDEDDEEDRMVMPYVSFSAPPKVTGWIGPAVDYLCQTFKREEMVIEERLGVGNTTKERARITGKKEFCLRVGPDVAYQTKFRVPPGVELPDVIVNPTYKKLATLIDG